MVTLLLSLNLGLRAWGKDGDLKWKPMHWFQQAEKQLQRSYFHISEPMHLCKSIEFPFFRQDQNMVCGLSNIRLHILAAPVFSTDQDVSYISPDATPEAAKTIFCSLLATDCFPGAKFMQSFPVSILGHAQKLSKTVHERPWTYFLNPDVEITS